MAVQGNDSVADLCALVVGRAALLDAVHAQAASVVGIRDVHPQVEEVVLPGQHSVALARLRKGPGLKQRELYFEGGQNI